MAIAAGVGEAIRSFLGTREVIRQCQASISSHVNLRPARVMSTRHQSGRFSAARAKIARFVNDSQESERRGDSPPLCERSRFGMTEASSHPDEGENKE